MILVPSSSKLDELIRKYERRLEHSQAKVAYFSTIERNLSFDGKLIQSWWQSRDEAFEEILHDLKHLT